MIKLMYYSMKYGQKSDLITDYMLMKVKEYLNTRID